MRIAGRLGVAQVGVLHDVFGLTGAAQHAVGDGEEQRIVALELLSLSCRSHRSCAPSVAAARPGARPGRARSPGRSAGSRRRPAQRFGQVLLVHHGVLVVVGVLVALAVAEAVHQAGGGVAQVQRHGVVARASPRPAARRRRPVDGVALGRQRPGRRRASARASAPSGTPRKWTACCAAIASGSACGSARPMSSIAMRTSRRATIERVFARLQHARPASRARRRGRSRAPTCAAPRSGRSAARRPCRIAGRGAARRPPSRPGRSRGAPSAPAARPRRRRSPAC